MPLVLYVVAIYLQTITTEPGTPVSYPGITWSSRSGDFMSLRNTDATFNWTHTNVPHPVNIAWYYKGTKVNPELTYILGYSNNEKYIPITDLAPRIDYMNYPGSATMILRNVTSADGGLYESKVVVLDEARIHDVPYISDIGSLSVISESSLRFKITRAGEPYDLSVAYNGTEMSLPDYTLTPPNKLDISVKVRQSSPRPTDILIQNRFGTYLYREHSSHMCAHSYTCNKTFQFSLARMTSEDQEAELNITINFNIQNLGPIHISSAVEINGTGVTPEIEVGNNSTMDFNDDRRPIAVRLVVSNIIWCIVCLVLVLVLVLIIIRYKRELQKQSRSERGPTGDASMSALNALKETSI